MFGEGKSVHNGTTLKVSKWVDFSFERAKSWQIKGPN